MRISPQTSSLPHDPATAARTPRAEFRPLRALFLLLLLAVAAVLEPHAFRFLLRQGLRLEGWRNQVDVRIGRVEGSLFEPITLRDSVWVYGNAQGPITRVEVQSATAVFSWRALSWDGSAKVFQKLTLSGVVGKTLLPREAVDAEKTGVGIPRPEGHWLPRPARIEARDVDFIVQSNADYVRLAEMDFTLSEMEAGTIHAGQIHVRQPWLARTFREVHGTTALQESKVEIANLVLERDVEVRDFSAALDELARGWLNIEVQLAAFGGAIRMEAQTLAQERPFAIEASGTFSMIQIANLATFLGVSDAAGGTIKNGKFSYRGSPRQIEKAAASLRLEATNFQWESRQWNSLILGATLLNGRVQVPELALTQAHNRLNLNGEMALPVPGVAWWQAEFSCNIAAKLDNLTELSALMLPEFTFAAGRAEVRGAVRGKNQQFNGQLIVSGSDLKWRNAPIDELSAGVNLNGNEFQITNLSLFNDGDYLRGRGVVNIVGDKQYWGEFHASVQDLAMYKAILRQPLVPEPLAGGAVMDWSGEGSAKGHSGKFLAQLRKVRSLGATASRMHPINADLEGSYAAAGVAFSRFALSDDESSFTANVAVQNKTLSVQGIRLVNKQALWLEGDAVLPLDVWNGWPNTSIGTLFDSQAPGKLQLAFYNLQLREASLLTGWKFPFEGSLRGSLNLSGPPGAITGTGKLSLSKARLPLGATGLALTEVDADVLFEGQKMTVQKWVGKSPAGDFDARGHIDFAKLYDPSLDLAVKSRQGAMEWFGGSPFPMTATAALALTISGPLSAAKVAGDAQILALAQAAPLDLQPLLTGEADLEMSPPLAWSAAPWSAWALEVSCKAASAPVQASWLVPGAEPAARGTCDGEVKLVGSASGPTLAGTVRLANIPVRSGSALLWMEQGTVAFRADFPSMPVVSLDLVGRVAGETFHVTADGPLRNPVRLFLTDPPLTESVARAELSRTVSSDDQLAGTPLSLAVPAALMGGVEISGWEEIATPVSSATPPSEAK